MSNPVSIFDAAAYICEHFNKSSSRLTTMKLQKLLYYCQAWSLVWNEEPLFTEEIQAWANGPVIKELYDHLRGLFDVNEITNGNSSHLNEMQKETIDLVLEAYGKKTAQWLSDLTHLETPWREARKGLNPGDRGCNVIGLGILCEYYGSLDQENNCLNENEV